MKRLILIFACLAMQASVLQAANVEEIITYSKAMDKKIPALVITPDSYEQGHPLPVVYLLHGHGGTYKTGWCKDDLYIKKFADKYNLILVLPDGGRDSWYFDSPVDPSIKYETYICAELIPYIDRHFSTIASREGRAITGLSMGGHGALYLSFRNQGLFGAAGSTSGGVDFRPWPNSWGIADKLGPYNTHNENWDKNTVMNMIYLLSPGGLALIIDCGTGDFFYEVNEMFHKTLLYHNISHEYITRPGEHNWQYWKNSIDYQLLFMSNYFAGRVN